MSNLKFEKDITEKISNIKQHVNYSLALIKTL